MNTITKAQHTPGPWHTKHHGIGSIGLSIVAESGVTVGTARDAMDARLIASAPHLLAACKASEEMNTRLIAYATQALGARFIAELRAVDAKLAAAIAKATD